MKRFIVIFVISLLTAVGLLARETIADAVSRNTAGLLLLRGLAGDTASLKRAGALLRNDSACSAHWRRGLIAQDRGDTGQRDAEWEAFLRCEPAGAVMVEAFLPDDLAWAERAVELAPASGEAWFWLARLLERADPSDAAEAYARGLERSPYDAMRWQSYGFVLMRTAGEDAALPAFIRSCELGGNGCRRVGDIMMRRGDIRTAIQYYRADPSLMFQRYADELEAKLNASVESH
ncbi:MAG: tetratricopeptide repeat protein [Anaerolineae bacterium]